LADERHPAAGFARTLQHLRDGAGQPDHGTQDAARGSEAGEAHLPRAEHDVQAALTDGCHPGTGADTCVLFSFLYPPAEWACAKGCA
jgi:hypothetical protein